jgi:hypothetical protein
MKRLLQILFFAGLVVLAPQAKSTHVMGSEISYNCIGQDSFMVSLILYRDCNGIFFQQPQQIIVNCITTSARLQALVIPIPTPIDITPVCKSSCTRCQTSSCTFPYSTEKYVFQKLLILNNAGTCCKISLSWTACCRNTTITTGMASGSFWAEAMLDRCVSPCDNSPRFTIPPKAISCIGQDFYYNNGVYDPDYDSLGFEWVYPRGSGASNLSYSGQYDYNKPTFFWGSQMLTFLPQEDFT